MQVFYSRGEMSDFFPQQFYQQRTHDETISELDRIRTALMKAERDRYELCFKAIAKMNSKIYLFYCNGKLVLDLKMNLIGICNDVQKYDHSTTQIRVVFFLKWYIYKYV